MDMKLNAESVIMKLITESDENRMLNQLYLTDYVFNGYLDVRNLISTLSCIN